MYSKKPIEELVTCILQELERRNYAENSRNCYRTFYNRVVKFAKSKGEEYYSEDIGRNFLESSYNFKLSDYGKAIPRRLRSPVRFIRVLGDYQLHGSIVRRHSNKKPYKYPEQYTDVLMAFEQECNRRGYSPQGMRTRMRCLRAFVDYLDDQGVSSCDHISGHELSQYTATLVGYNSKTVAAILTIIRTFLKFLYLNGYHLKDISCDLPYLKNYYYPRIPSVWKVDDVKRMLEAVDRGNPTGKRDYAILLIVTRLGMRVGDIKGLKLSNLKWDTKKIEIVQQKTARSVNYPILEDIGWAIIDYLQHGRPKTLSPYLFIRHNAPFEPFGMNANLHNIITKYTRLAGIKIPSGTRHGMHSLRHTLASILLEHHTPLPVISDILGHMSVQSTSVYLKIDLDGLRKCALDPEEVFLYAEN